MSLFYLAVFVLIVEIGLLIIVNVQKKNFPWIITKQDELPDFDDQALQKFINYSFDPGLGWVRRPNSGGTEHGKKGKITFNINSIGSRKSEFDILPPYIAAFGDSYTFCRQVEDNETWEVHLSKKENVGVLNFGVGNYGLDQALLRYENTELADTVKIVIMGFVPETICRIQSCWKHYLEFGNTFAFKPRFVLDSTGRLSLMENPVRSLEDFYNLEKKLPDIRRIDGFYNKKFRPLQFRSPYIITLLRNPVRQSLLILSVALRWMIKTAGITNKWVQDLPFMLVMKNNIRDAHGYYEDMSSTELLSAILLRFKKIALSRGHIPLVLVMPQLLDIKLTKKKASYQCYFDKMAQQIPLLDLTDTFVDQDLAQLYINDQYGGHLSVDGNILVAEKISSWVSEYKQTSDIEKAFN